MSAARDALSDNKHRFSMYFNAVITIIVVFLAQFLSANEVDNREQVKEVKTIKEDLNRKATIDYVNQISKFNKDYTDKSLADHEKTEQIRYESIEKMFTIIMTDQTEMKRDIKSLIKNSK